ncbi:CTD kinase subunit gamma CTK3-domain-containing protein [Lobosporangium transversale]|uniref:CTD kinase subunit gamma CTK3-domain-containing protein n=1 Tax=Lobosporangium transversale TaxID=64571 RepID=A0A1Y2GEZ8_9FUNG|nr:CTD kinase subunit gamma CTK3-domain-containing protein [Lobosporangium transversale]ORZ07066.1 CTD kinase subunit gamma CTK3-domain-containing protein [Lobosporangium transversale]|eukprot:XP_021877862.1 CTD kinase subunit gamma CTK3-domain-containing protein [Lobosporangium transversale]
MEVDPFEARLEFRGLLGRLNASQHSIQKVGNFAMRNKNLHEDLYSCIIEELEQTPSINTKMNIFYVLDSICHQSHKAGFSGYMDLIQRNLHKIIECVTPSGPKGNVNVAGTKKILDSWRAKRLFNESVIDKVEKPLLSRDLGANTLSNAEAGFTKDDILKRMDEDRERHKRIREEIWIRPPDEDSDAEFLQSWDEVSDMEENDYEDIESENEKYLPNYPWSLEFDRFLPSPAIFKSKTNSTSATTFDSSLDSGAVATKRLTSPEGTVSVSNAGAGAGTGATQVSGHHNGYHGQHNVHFPHQPTSQQQVYSPTSASATDNNYIGSTISRSHFHSYYDSSIPTAPTSEGPAPSYRTSPSSTYQPFPRTHYQECTTSSGGSLQSGHSNGHSDRGP